MPKRKKSERTETNTSAGKSPRASVTIRVDQHVLRDLDRMAELRGSSRSQMLQQAVEFYTWMARGGAAVQMFEPWADPDLVSDPDPLTNVTRAGKAGPEAKPPVERAGRRIDESESLRASQNSDDSVPAGLSRETDSASFRATG